MNRERYSGLLRCRIRRAFNYIMKRFVLCVGLMYAWVGCWPVLQLIWVGVNGVCHATHQLQAAVTQYITVSRDHAEEGKMFQIREIRGRNSGLFQYEWAQMFVSVCVGGVLASVYEWAVVYTTSSCSQQLVTTLTFPQPKIRQKDEPLV